MGKTEKLTTIIIESHTSGLPMAPKARITAAYNTGRRESITDHLAHQATDDTGTLDSYITFARRFISNQNADGIIVFVNRDVENRVKAQRRGK